MPDPSWFRDCHKHHDVLDEAAVVDSVQSVMLVLQRVAKAVHMG